MWKLILKADVEFFDKEAAKNRSDMLGYYEVTNDTIYLNHWAIFQEVKKKNVKISEATVINRIMAVLSHETFHAAVHPHLEDHIEEFIRKNITDIEEIVENMKQMLLNTMGHIWQEVGVRIYQEGQHPDQAIVNVIHKDSGYRKKINDAMKEYKFFAEDYKKKTGENIYVSIVEFVDEFITDNIQKMLEKLNHRIKNLLDAI